MRVFVFALLISIVLSIPHPKQVLGIQNIISDFSLDVLSSKGPLALESIKQDQLVADVTAPKALGQGQGQSQPQSQPQSQSQSQSQPQLQSQPQPQSQLQSQLQP